MGKPKLRDLYASDKDAAEFLSKHPEFAGFELESTQDAPSNAAYYTRERDPANGSKALIIQEALATYPDAAIVQLLTLYYGGATMRQLSRSTKTSPTNTKHRIARAKAKVYEWAVTRPLDEHAIKNLKVLDKKTFLYKGRTAKAIKSPRYGWVLEDGKRLPDNVQDALDAMDWDLVDLDSTE